VDRCELENPIEVRADECGFCIVKNETHRTPLLSDPAALRVLRLVHESKALPPRKNERQCALF
jgi:hypothetical protein